MLNAIEFITPSLAVFYFGDPKSSSVVLGFVGKVGISSLCCMFSSNLDIRTSSIIFSSEMSEKIEGDEETTSF